MDECILFDGYINKDGYGGMRTEEGWTNAVHRVFWQREYGPLAKGIVLHHICGNRACVNLAHLQPMTNGEHTRLHRSLTPSWQLRRAATHCKRGHAFDAENTRWDTRKDGYIVRVCRTCKRERRWERECFSTALAGDARG